MSDTAAAIMGWNMSKVYCPKCKKLLSNALVTEDFKSEKSDDKPRIEMITGNGTYQFANRKDQEERVAKQGCKYDGK